MASAEKIHIIGIGEDGLSGLTAAARGILDAAQVVVGEQRVLDMLANSSAEPIVVGTDVAGVAEKIAAAGDRPVVLLTSGDPLFYGVARYLCDKLGKDRFEVMPHVSSMQLAFARVKESWDEAYLANLAVQKLDRVLEKIRTAEKAGLFTTDETPPAAVAQALLDRRIDYFTAYVCENLGSPDERVTWGELSDVAQGEFAPLNVLILIRRPGVPDRPAEMIGRRLFGNPDEAFLQSKPKRGLLTGADVRCLALADMDLGPTSVVWDIGAGSGSVAVEAAQIAAGGTTYAIEMDAEDHQLISSNAQRFGVANLIAILGKAPEAWEELPDPDAVFIGGAGQGIVRIVELALARLKPAGRLVANVASIENLHAVHSALQKLGETVTVRMINIAHATDQLETIRFEALNPTFLVSVVKKD